jgi:hypothetical protein
MLLFQRKLAVVLLHFQRKLGVAAGIGVKAISCLRYEYMKSLYSAGANTTDFGVFRLGYCCCFSASWQQLLVLVSQPPAAKASTLYSCILG